MFELAVDDICDMITTKQMLKDYGDGSFGGGSGPLIQCLDKRKRARNDSILKKLCKQVPAMRMQIMSALRPEKKNKKKKGNT